MRDPELRRRLHEETERGGELAELCGEALAAIEVTEVQNAQMATVVALAALVVVQWRAACEGKKDWDNGRDADFFLVALARACDQLGEP
jgi:hypothetical protein